jgi:hypothetical protein
MRKILMLVLGRYAWRWFQKRRGSGALRGARVARRR